MEHTVYVCTGGCKGVSNVSKSCGAQDCAHFGRPLEPRRQCASCREASQKDSAPRACESCAAL